MSHVEIPFVSQQPFLFVNNLLAYSPFFLPCCTKVPTCSLNGLRMVRVEFVAAMIEDVPGFTIKPLLIGLADAILESLEKMQLNNGFRSFAILRPGLVSVSPDSPGRSSRTMHQYRRQATNHCLRAA